MPISETARKAIDAAGGVEFWNKAEKIEAVTSARGLAFILKGRPFFRKAKIELEVRKPYCKLTPIGRDKEISGVLDGGDVRLEDPSGKVVAERKNARSVFPGGRRLIYWDDLDMAYFANYAYWNYFTYPALLMNDAIDWKETNPGELVAKFPESIPTHSEEQRFVFDRETGFLLQHDYNADIIAKLATAANVVLERKTENEVAYPTRRRVTPRTGSGGFLRFPILIDITIHSFRFL